VKSETDLKGDLAFPTRARGVAHPGAGGDSGHLRRLNLDRVLVVAMNRPDSFTRAELIEATGLSAPTVGSLVSHLIRSGVVRELGAGPSRGGRRPAFMEFNARHGFVAGIDLGPTRTRLSVADLRGETIEQLAENTTRNFFGLFTKASPEQGRRSPA